jgi:hypothetical protein
MSQAKVDLRVAIENVIEQAADSCHDATLWWQAEEKGPRIIDTLVSMIVIAIEKNANWCPTAPKCAKCKGDGSVSRAVGGFIECDACNGRGF